MPAHNEGRDKAPNDLEVFFVDLVKSAALLEAEEEATPRLSASDDERASAMADREAARHWRATRIATRIVLERAGGDAFRRLNFEIETGGRPRLAGAPHFNVSHTGEAALIVVSKEMQPGVDLERRERRLRMSDERRQRIISAAQRMGARQALSPASDTDVIVAWVRLEAAAKALGSGIGRLLTEHGVVGGSRAVHAQDSEFDLQIRDLVVGDQFVAAVAAQRLPERIDVTLFPADNLGGFISGK
ncbi:phosphopantetheinyl transferase [Hyphomicrobium sp.]|uniref:4'-phosphopantetheinyl transferase family protein n=1 Tax=Hyphomicrobium sp. TaxID=82 RepID=UPI001D1AF305|nr:phosphopantetheinyl transferase [Hyphomicrobium sp.]MBY0559984.1 phosphopantetheinyl transferase [Hyphomicrobium sp.]